MFIRLIARVLDKTMHIKYLLLLILFIPQVDEKEVLKKSLGVSFLKLANSEALIDNIVSKDEKKTEEALHTIFGFKEKPPLAVSRKDRETILKHIIPKVKGDEIRQFIAVNIITHDLHLRPSFRAIVKSLLLDENPKTRLHSIDCLTMLIPEKCGNTVRQLEDSIVGLLRDKDKDVQIAGIHICTQLRIRLDSAKFQIRVLIGDPDPKIALAAIHGSLAMGDFEAIKEIQRLLNNPNPTLKATAMSILAGLDLKLIDPGNKPLKEILIKLTDDKEKSVKLAAIGICARYHDKLKLDDKELKELKSDVLKLIKDNDINNKKFALSLLPSLKLTDAKEVKDEMLKALKGSDKDLKIMAITYVVEKDIKEARKEILDLLQDKESQIKEEALMAVRKLKMTEAKDKIISLISDKQVNKAILFGVILDMDLKETKGLLLNTLKEPHFDPMLLVPLFTKFGVTFNDLKPYLNHDYTIQLIVRLKMNAAKDDLIKIVKGKDARLKSEAIRAMVQMGIKDAKTEIIEGLSDSNEEIRHEALHACYELGFTEAKEKVVKMLDDPSPLVQEAAIHGCEIYEIKDEKLIKLLDSDEDNVRLNAITATSVLKMKQAEQKIISFVLDEDYPIYVEALLALARFSNRNFLTNLLEILQHDYSSTVLVEVNRLKNDRLFKALEALTFTGSEKSLDDIIKEFKTVKIKFDSELPKELHTQPKVRFEKCSGIQLLVQIAEQMGVAFVLDSDEVLITIIPKAIYLLSK